MDFINLILTRIFDIVIWPFASMPTTGLVVVSAVVGVAMTYLFGKVSPQKHLRRTADQCRAQLLAISLFKDDLGVTEFPEIETTLIDGDVAFRQHRGGHVTGPNWPTFLNFTDRYFEPHKGTKGTKKRDTW